MTDPGPSARSVRWPPPVLIGLSAFASLLPPLSLPGWTPFWNYLFVWMGRRSPMLLIGGNPWGGVGTAVALTLLALGFGWWVATVSARLISARRRHAAGIAGWPLAVRTLVAILFAPIGFGLLVFGGIVMTNGAAQLLRALEYSRMESLIAPLGVVYAGAVMILAGVMLLGWLGGWPGSDKAESGAEQ